MHAALSLLLHLSQVSVAQAPPVVLGASVPDLGSGLSAQRLTTQVTVDGELIEPAWNGQPAINGLTQRNPKEGAPPSEPTLVYLAYDNSAIYVAARLLDAAPDSIVARLGRRDALTASDRFTLYLDPYHDKRSGFYFAIDAAGTLSDGTLFNDDWNDNSWDGVWEGKARRTKEGWVVEMRIPFSQLRFQSQDAQLWGVNIRREIARKNEEDFLVCQPKGGSGFVSRFPDLTGLDQVKPPRRLEVLPYVSGQMELEKAPSGDPFNDGSTLDGSAGMDLRAGFGPNVTLAATVNPDFGQVEVDPAVVNLTDVETFYPEKRPFFVEGSTLFTNYGGGGSNNFYGFNYPGTDLFYSRRIGRAPQGAVPAADYYSVPSGTGILGAAKVTGKVGQGLSLGSLFAVTSREYADLSVSGNQFRAEVEPMTYYGVVRALNEFGQGRQGLGFMGTVAHRDFQDPLLKDQLNENALVGGLDGWTFLDSQKRWVMTGWVAGSRVSGTPTDITAVQQSSVHYLQRPDARYFSLDTLTTSLTGFGGRTTINKQSGNIIFNAAFGVLSPGFEANDLGFQTRADMINMHVVGGYRWTTPNAFFRSATLQASTFRTYDFDGNRTWEGYWMSGFTEFLNYMTFEWGIGVNPWTVSTRRTRGGPIMLTPSGGDAWFWYQTNQQRALSLGLGGWGVSYQEDHQQDWGVDVRLDWRPMNQLALSFGPSLEKRHTGTMYVGTFPDPLATATYGSRYVFSRLDQTTVYGSLRANWIFTPKLSLELYVQPLISSGSYTAFKEFSAPGTYDFLRYGTGGSTFDPTTNTADPDGPGGPAQPIVIGNPDFTDVSLRGNAVLRWEYLPGSTIFLVWTQNRFNSSPEGDFNFPSSMDQLIGADPVNVLAVKITYWWNP